MRVRAENRIYKSMNMRGTAQEVRGMREAAGVGGGGATALQSVR